jgi:hypothetical protein
MGVLKDYLCDAHGIFESMEAKCPMKGCQANLSVVFLKPVALGSAKTKKTDQIQKQLAMDFDMTDIKSTKEGEHQTGYLKRKNKLTDKQFAEATEAIKATNQNAAQMQPREARPGDSVLWGNGGNINLKSVMGGQFKPIKDESVGMLPRDVGNFSQPKAGQGTMVDHEGLKVQT